MGNDPIEPVINGTLYDLVILADGGWSTLREKNITQKQPEYSGVLIYRLKLTRKIFQILIQNVFIQKKRNNLNAAMDNAQDRIMGGISLPVPERNVTKPTSAVNRQADLKQDTTIPSWFLPLYPSYI